MGQVDFYPNGGMAPQPGCENEDPLGIDCSHARAPVSFQDVFNCSIRASIVTILVKYCDLYLHLNKVLAQYM